MEDEEPAKRESKFEAAARGQSSSLVGDTVGFLRENKKWWLLPIFTTLLLLSLLLLLSGTVVAPFIYTLF